MEQRETKRIKKLQEGNKLEKILQTTPGIHSFAKVSACSHNKEDISETAISLLNEYTKTSKKAFSFKVETKRSNKNFPMKSPEISQWLGGELFKCNEKKTGSVETDNNLSNNLSVDVHNPDFILFVNIAEKEAYLYLGKKLGMGGLPSRSSGKIISLLSGGIDSPVASILMMQRGCEIILFHAYNHGTDTKAVKNKVELLAQKIANFQGKVNLIMLTYHTIQKEIVGQIPGPYRMISFKRSIVRVANLLAKKFNAKAIINGDSVGQVASQTLENIQCIYAVSNLPILSPLIGIQKSDIIKLSQKFGTYETSIMPYDDCCSLIATGNPVTRGDLAKIEEYEKETKLLEIEEELTERVDIVKFVIK